MLLLQTPAGGSEPIEGTWPGLGPVEASRRWQLRQFVAQPFGQSRQILDHRVVDDRIFDPVVTVNNPIAQADGEGNFRHPPTDAGVGLIHALAGFAKISNCRSIADRTKTFATKSVNERPAENSRASL